MGLIRLCGALHSRIRPTSSHIRSPARKSASTHAAKIGPDTGPRN